MEGGVTRARVDEELGESKCRERREDEEQEDRNREEAVLRVRANGAAVARKPLSAESRNVATRAKTARNGKAEYFDAIANP